MDMVIKRAKKSPTDSPSRVHERRGVATFVLCATEAAAIDRKLGRTLIHVAGVGRVVAEVGPAIVVCRLAWNESKPADWPLVFRSKHPVPGADFQVNVYAEFTDPNDSALAWLLSQPWCLRTTTNTRGTFTAHLDGQALAALVEVIGEYAPVLSDGHDPDRLAPSLGGSLGLPQAREVATHATVILFYWDSSDCLSTVNDWLLANGYERGLVSVEDPALRANWYVTTGKAMGGEMAVGAFSGLRVKEFVAFLRRCPWTGNDSDIQLGILTRDEEKFQLRPIRPLSYDNDILSGFGGADNLDLELGPVIDPLIIITDIGPKVRLLVMGAVQVWLSQQAPQSELHRIDDLNISAWGLYDPGRPKRGYVISGSFGHAWCRDFSEFLCTLPWDAIGKDGEVYLMTGSVNGWRSLTRVGTGTASSASRHYEVSGWSLLKMRAFLAETLASESRRFPATDDLTRFDEECLRYMRGRGHVMVEAASE
jgi:hypothetical protein